MSSPAAQLPITDLIFDIARSAARPAASPKVYPAYIAFQCKAALKAAMQTKEFVEGPIVASVSDLETLGSARYAFTATDHNGADYRVTIELLPTTGKAVRS